MSYVIVLEHKRKGQRWSFLGAWPTWTRAKFEGNAHHSGNCDCDVRLRKFVYARQRGAPSPDLESK